MVHNNSQKPDRVVNKIINRHLNEASEGKQAAGVHSSQNTHTPFWHGVSDICAFDASFFCNWENIGTSPAASFSD